MSPLTFPPAAPFVALLNFFGLSTGGADNAYDHQGEVKIEALLAALLVMGFQVLSPHALGIQSYF